MGGTRFRADPVLVSLLNGVSVLYDAVAIVLFTSLEKHIDEASPALLTLDVLGLFVLVFFGSFLFGVIPGAWSPGVTTKQSISVCSRITRSAPCVSPHISRLPSHSSGVLSGIVSIFFPQFMLSENTALVSEGTALVSEDTALVSEDTALVSENTALVSENTALVSGDTALVSEGTALVSEDTALVSVDTALVSVQSALVSVDTTLVSLDTTLVSVDTALVSS